jgi:hypothetical protein
VVSRDALRQAMPLTQAELHRQLRYDALTGRFYWNAKGGVPGGKRAGTARSDGRRQIIVNGKNYKEHRLVWLYVTGKWPASTIDHIDGDPSNNRFENLRDIPHAINVQNKRVPQSNNKTGLLGVSRDKHRRGWLARIHVNDTTIRRGPYSTPEEAHAVYLALKRQIHAGCTL